MTLKSSLPAKLTSLGPTLLMASSFSMIAFLTALSLTIRSGMNAPKSFNMSINYTCNSTQWGATYEWGI